MTLAEFAELELEKMNKDMEMAKQRQQHLEEEEEKLGIEGVEEKKRKETIQWENWKDNHPPFSITNKGNYS